MRSTPAQSAEWDTAYDTVDGSLSGAVVSGFKWKIATTVVSEGTRVGAAVVLARLLTPKDYGVAGMAMVFAGFVALFTDLGFGAALVQRRAITEDDRSTAFWASLGVAAIAASVTVALSGEVAAFFGQAQVRVLVIVLSVGFPLGALSATQSALLNRQLAYRSLELRQIFGVLVGAVVAIVVAVRGYGVWAIVANFLATNATSTVLLWYFSSWRPHFRFSRASLLSMGGFGMKLTGTRILHYANLNTDNTLVGRFLGAPALGTYGLAYNVMFTPMTRINLPIYAVITPALSRMQHDPPRLRSAWLRSKRLSAALLAPAFLAIIVVAPDFVRVVFGSKWDAAVPVVRLLCVAGLAHSLVALNSTILQAQGEAGWVLRVMLLTSAVTLSAFAAGLPWGIVGVAGFFAGAKWLLVVPDTWITTRKAGVPFWAALTAAGATLPFGIVAAAAAYGLRVVLVHAGAPPILRLLAAAATVFVLYAGLVFVGLPSLVAEVKRVLGQRRTGAPSGVVSVRPLASQADGRPTVATDSSTFLVFAPTPDGYRLIECDGTMPPPGGEVRVPGYEGTFVVSRLGVSPLPFDVRPCAYLEAPFL